MAVISRYLTRTEAAGWLTEQGLPVKSSQLQKLATTGGGPPYSIFGNRAVYAIEDLLAWVESRLAAGRKAG